MGDGRPAEVTLFHDRTANGKYDGTIARAFDQLIADEHFKHAQYFTTIKPLNGEECVPLQPADLVAFEAAKYAEQQAKKRRSFEAMLDLPEFGIHVKMFTKEILQRMKRTIEERQTGS